MIKPVHVYVTYIVATPEKVWDALTKPEFTKQYFFGRAIESDWKINSPWRFAMPDGSTDCAGTVLDYDPPRRLALSWRVERFEETRKLPFVTVTYEIEPLGDLVRVTMQEIHHEDVEPKYHEGGRRGWPIIMSGMKSLVETGKALPAFEMKG